LRRCVGKATVDKNDVTKVNPLRNSQPMQIAKQRRHGSRGSSSTTSSSAAAVKVVTVSYYSGNGMQWPFSSIAVMAVVSAQ